MKHLITQDLSLVANCAAPEPEPQWWSEFDFEVKIRQSILMRKIFSEKTPYQNLEIYEHDLLGRILVLDDILQTTTADEFIYSEMMAHVPILGRPQESCDPRDFRILIVGGGDGGVIREVLKHPFVTEVIMVELDEFVVKRCNEFLGFQGDYNDPRAHLIFGDGAAYIKQERASGHFFDAVIVDSTDPYGPGEVLFTEEFFEDIRNILKPYGTFMRHIGIPFHQRKFLLQGFDRMKKVFGHVQLYRATIPTYVGGEMGFLISSHSRVDCAKPFCEFRGRYYTPQMHRASFILPPWMCQGRDFD